MSMLDWIPAIPTVLVAVAILVLPGAAVIIAGWGVDLRWLMAAPAVSIAIVAGSAIVAGAVGWAWGALPVVVITGVVALVAWALRRLTGAPERTRDDDERATLIGGALGLLAGGAILVRRLLAAFVEPGSVSFSFDNTFHLNAAVFAVETRNASAFHIGEIGGTGLYPNGWNSLTSLTMIITGSDAAVAINSVNIALVALVWPVSAMLLAWAFFRGRPLALFVSGVLSAAFAAFPFQFFNWGVLYPNVAGYVLVPATVAVALGARRERNARARAMLIVLTLAMLAGTLLAHPNAFLITVTFVVALLMVDAFAYAASRGTVRVWAWTLAASTAALAAGAALYVSMRTHFNWPEWQTPEQAIGEGLLVAPDHIPPTLGLTVLLVAGYVWLARHPRELRLAVPFVIALAMFTLNTGTESINRLRELVGDPFYNDNWRFAALLGITAIPIATAGALALYDAARSAAARLPERWHGRWATITGRTIAVLALLLTATGPAVDQLVTSISERQIARADDTYVTDAELELIERLEETTPPDALIIGIPIQGASFAYGIGGRQVVEPHIHGPLSDDELYLTHHLNEIDSDPRVCEAVLATGVTHVLDFGDVLATENTGNDKTYEGLFDLEPGPHLRVVDQTGSDARLLEIVNC